MLTTVLFVQNTHLSIRPAYPVFNQKINLFAISAKIIPFTLILVMIVALIDSLRLVQLVLTSTSISH